MRDSVPDGRLVPSLRRRLPLLLLLRDGAHRFCVRSARISAKSWEAADARACCRTRSRGADRLGTSARCAAGPFLERHRYLLRLTSVCCPVRAPQSAVCRLVKSREVGPMLVDGDLLPTVSFGACELCPGE